MVIVQMFQKNVVYKKKALLFVFFLFKEKRLIYIVFFILKIIKKLKKLLNIL